MTNHSKQVTAYVLSSYLYTGVISKVMGTVNLHGYLEWFHNKLYVSTAPGFWTKTQQEAEELAESMRQRKEQYYRLGLQQTQCLKPVFKEVLE